jgi:FkbM family methyltransferase
VRSSAATNLANQILRTIGRHLPPQSLSAGGRVDRTYARIAAAGRLTPINVVVDDRFGNRFRVFRQALSSFVNSFDLFVYYFGLWEPSNTYTVRRLVKPGAICVDAGANVGWYTILLASLTGPSGTVHAFEPSPDAMLELEENVALNGRSGNVVLNRTGLGRTVEEARTLYSTGSSLYSSLYEVPRNEASVRISDLPLSHPVIHTIAMTSLDQYADERRLSRIDFLKLDVEGAEFDVLRGAEKFFDRSQCRPTIQLEVNPATAKAAGYTTTAMLQWLQHRWGYRFYRVTLTGALAEFSTVNQAGADLQDIFCISASN